MIGLVEKKQRGEQLSEAEITRAIADFHSGKAPDYQMAALLMAIYFQGLTPQETTFLTRALLNSGERWDLPAAYHPLLDKHSTGGVGDKTTLLLVPMLAAAGFKGPKMSGRGLAHTGGTIDKLESIPGLRTELSQEEARRQLAEVGCLIISQSERLVPAEKKLYALRDATGTVSQQGLIISSILSKKLASGATHIVIDVKHGSGAFFKREGEAYEFAELFVGIAKQFKPSVAAVVTNMEHPLGYAVGNALEVAEVLGILRDRDTDNEVSLLCMKLGAVLLKLAGKTGNEEEGEELLVGALANRDAAAQHPEVVAVSMEHAIFIFVVGSLLLEM